MTPTYLRKIRHLIEITNEELSKLSLLFKAKRLSLYLTKPRENDLFSLCKTNYAKLNINIDGI